MTVYRGNRLDGGGHPGAAARTSCRHRRALDARCCTRRSSARRRRWKDPASITPDDVAAGAPLEDPVVVFDFDNYYMGGALAEHLARQAIG